MKIIHGLEAVDPPLNESVLTIGNFDGVHRAHQHLIAQAGLLAVSGGGRVVVLTFEPHPLTVVAPAKAPPRLSTSADKLHYLADAGTEITVVARSEPALLELEPERFVEDVLVRRFRPRHIVEGPSFGFGRGRRGNPDLLTRVAGRFGCQVHIVDPVTLQVDDGEALPVSSSLIRRLLISGDVRRAALCLGRLFALVGTVASGSRRGRTLGFPTANLQVEDQLIPAEGVYAGAARARDRRFPAAISIGRTPTFGEGERKIEVHLLGFDDDLYGESIRVEFNRFLRFQRTFASAEALVEQLRADVDSVRVGTRNDPYEPTAAGTTS